MSYMKPYKLAGSCAKKEHAKCIICGSDNASGLKLNFKSCKNGCIEAVFSLDERYEGYKGMLHGGIVAAILDGAMTNCMFAHGFKAVTAEMNVRFLGPVHAGKQGTVTAWIERSSSMLHILKAQIRQNQEIKAHAKGKFMKPHFAQ